MGSNEKLDALKIFEIRGKAVVLDSDLAAMYAVATKVFNQAFKRNINRFPEDFAFQVTEVEWDALRSQFVTSKRRGGRRYLPWVWGRRKRVEGRRKNVSQQ